MQRRDCLSEVLLENTGQLCSLSSRRDARTRGTDRNNHRGKSTRRKKTTNVTAGRRPREVEPERKETPTIYGQHRFGQAPKQPVTKTFVTLQTSHIKLSCPSARRSDWRPIPRRGSWPSWQLRRTHGNPPPPQQGRSPQVCTPGMDLETRHRNGINAWNQCGSCWTGRSMKAEDTVRAGE